MTLPALRMIWGKVGGIAQEVGEGGTRARRRRAGGGGGGRCGGHTRQSPRGGRVVVRPVLEGHAPAVGSGRSRKMAILSLRRFCKYALDFNGNLLLIPKFYYSPCRPTGEHKLSKSSLSAKLVFRHTQPKKWYLRVISRKSGACIIGISKFWCGWETLFCA
jgi:hypothetical protein